MTAYVPSSRPRASHDDVLKHVAAAGLDLAKEKAVLVAVRGYYLDTMGRPGVNDHGVYDDAMFLITPGGLSSWNANTDPQKVGAGHAMLAAGVYDFYPGKHKGKYDAWRPHPEGVRLPCTRDGKRSMCGATNIHKGGYSNTYSEGCLTIYPTQYADFIRQSYRTVKGAGKKTVKVVLVENK